MKPDLTAPIPAVDTLGAVHFIGIGGAGMSGIARILLARGRPVSGSDAKDSPALATLRSLGARVHLGHSADHLGDAATVVVSSAVRDTNPELVQARAGGLRVLHRSQALAAVMTGRRAVAVAGTAGKTTTTAMLTVALRHAGVDPSFAIGGELTQAGLNAHDGTGDVFVAEADESDGSFLLYSPTVAIITNVEPDHLDHYGTGEAVEAAFDAFADRIVPGGFLIACGDDPGAARVAARADAGSAAAGSAAAGSARRRVLTYGQAAGCDVQVVGLDASGAGVRFRLRTGQGALSDPIQLSVPGAHNALNAAAAWAAATSLGADPVAVAEGLASFGGTRRRFELKGEAGGVRVVDDYAHHPTKVAAALRAARAVAGQGRVVAVFQPHLYSRTRLFAAQFGAALGLADEVVVMDVYAAREDPEVGVTGALVSQAVPRAAEQVVFAAQPEQAVAEVVRRARPGDLVLTIGAGDVTGLGPQILQALAQGGPP